MKFMKWKILCITCLVCLLPIVPGLFLWESLPDSIAIHFDIHNNPDNYASKGFVVFGLPCMMLLLQVFCCFVNDINAAKHGDRVKFERVTKWIIPIMSIVLQGMTFAVALGQNVDVRKVAVLIVGIMLLVIGNYLPKFDYIKNYDIDTQKARKINRFIGFETVIMGVLFLASLFLPPDASLICIFLLIPYAVISILYGIKVGRK